MYGDKLILHFIIHLNDECKRIWRMKEFKSKTKKKFNWNLEDLFEEKFEEGKTLILDNFETFDLDSKFMSVKNFSLKNIKLRKEKELLKYISKLKDFIQNPMNEES